MDRVRDTGIVLFLAIVAVSLIHLVFGAMLSTLGPTFTILVGSTVVIALSYSTTK